MQAKAGNFQEGIHQADYLATLDAPVFQADQIISDFYRAKESLNGRWQFAVDQYDNCLRSKWYLENEHDADGRPYPLDYSFDLWEPIQVPSCWNLQSDKLFLYEGSLAYTRSFRYKNHGEKRVFIKFGAANYAAYVFVNKKYVGMHKGGSTPFYAEVTDVLEEQNRILVVVSNTRKSTNVPCENTDWFNYGGLYRDVELLRLPESFIQDFTLALLPDTNFRKIGATVRVNGTGGTGTALLSIEELGLRVEIPMADGVGRVELDAAPALWSPESPKLYDVQIQYGDDCLRDRVGFREIKVAGRDILLNGKAIFLKGICAHEESVINGKAVTEEEIWENYRLAKEMNCNYMRLAHYPHSEKAARIADEVGLMLWEEVPVYWAIDFENESVYQDAENQLSELIIRDRNRASVVIWSVGNENADTDARLSFMQRLAERAKALDPTRLVSAACLVNTDELKIEDRLADHIDIIGINEYYGWYVPDFSKLIRMFENSSPTKPVVISEFGADARAGIRGTQDDMFSEDNQLAIFRQQIDTLRVIPYVKGTSPWILFDFRCPRRTHTMQNYYNLKGLLSADKTHKKLAYYAMQSFYGSLD